MAVVDQLSLELHIEATQHTFASLTVAKHGLLVLVGSEGIIHE